MWKTSSTKAMKQWGVLLHMSRDEMASLSTAPYKFNAKLMVEFNVRNETGEFLSGKHFKTET